METEEVKKAIEQLIEDLEIIDGYIEAFYETDLDLSLERIASEKRILEIRKEETLYLCKDILQRIEKQHQANAYTCTNTGDVLSYYDLHE